LEKEKPKEIHEIFDQLPLCKLYRVIPNAQTLRTELETTFP